MPDITTKQIENIQIDEGIVFTNYGEADERQLAPSRGGGEFTVTNKLRNIEHDGAQGAEAGMQILEEQEAKLKVTILDTSQENLAMAIPGCVVEDDGSITNGENGLIPEQNYLKNVTMFAKLLGGKYKKIDIYRAMHEGALAMKAAPKAEGEIELEFTAHFDPKNSKEKIWRIQEVANIQPETPKTGG